MRNNIVPPEDCDSPARYRLTREFLALVAPGFDPDAAPPWEVAKRLADDRWYDFIERHPDRKLVAECRREERRYDDELFFEVTGHHADEHERN
jgi:hypothetical protein